jgi:hypothetical protein
VLKEQLSSSNSVYPVFLFIDRSDKKNGINKEIQEKKKERFAVAKS